MVPYYIALPFPDYQEYMEEEWFEEETYYDFNRDVYLIPIDRVHITKRIRKDMKSYTDIKQSKKLAEILPIESADMYYSDNEYPKQITKYIITYANVLYGSYDIQFFNICEYVPCWSLAALLDILPDDTNIIKDKSDTENEKYMCTVGVKGDIIPTFGKNPVDACYEMILKLHELKIL